MQKILELKLHGSEYLSIESEMPTQEMTACCDFIEIYFRNTTNYLISDDTFHYSIASLIDLLSEAIEGKLRLPASITKDIGYLWNEKCNGFSQETFETRLIEGTPRWLGIDYILWETSGKNNQSLTTWLYNNELGEIVLEITPNFIDTFINERQSKNAYSKFIAAYKPILVRTIPLDVAKRWVAQAQHLLEFVKNK